MRAHVPSLPRPTGATLLELLLALALIALLMATAALPFRGVLDRLAVRSAARSLGWGLERARVLAQAEGGAVLLVDAPRARYWIESPRGALLRDTVPLLPAPGAVSVTGAAGVPVRIAYSALGLGQVASCSFSFSRGAARAGVTVSSYGRAVLW